MARSYGKSRYLTTQHERDTETGFDYRGARFYDSEVGRFLSVDPLAEKYAGWSTYNYVMGSPIKLVDPDGRTVIDPETGREVAKVDGEWKTIIKKDKHGNVKKYGNVSETFA